MIRGIKWLMGALAVSALVLGVLNGVCSSHRDFPALTEFFCPQPRGVAGPQPRLKKPVGR
ncbi:MAG: hypothetical protein QF787_01475 [Nitrospinota bacterium]|nr:hypothetical protein [Nitrospinota bacterium]